MFAFFKTVFAKLAHIFRPVEPWEQYLNEATDVADLERRIRDITR